MKTKEEKIKELEDKVRVTDLTVYEKETFKKSLVKGTISGMVTFAIPVSVSKAFMFLPSLPIILPFISSFGSETTDTVVSDV